MGKMFRGRGFDEELDREREGERGRGREGEREYLLNVWYMERIDGGSRAE